MKLIENICTKSDCYKAGKKITVKGLMIHSVGCPQPKALPFINNWNKPGASACVHAIIEPDGDVYQLLPWNHRGWHGGGACNNTHIGVEMTEPDTIAYTGGSSWKEKGNGAGTKNHVLATYRYAVELFAYLCDKFSLDPLADGVIISHSEGHKRGIASNHGDVEHIWSKFGLTMAQFRKDIKNSMGKAANGGQTPSTAEPAQMYRVRKTWADAKSQKGAFKSLANAKKCADGNKGYYVFDEKGNAVYPGRTSVPYSVRVSITDLNIRTGPGTNYTKVQHIPVGTYTIVEEADGKGASKWGRLKSGAGWISLDYCKKI